MINKSKIHLRVFELRNMRVRRTLKSRVQRHLFENVLALFEKNYDRLNIVVEPGLPLGCAHIGGSLNLSCITKEVVESTNNEENKKTGKAEA
jgi:hypothetical protein